MAFPHRKEYEQFLYSLPEKYPDIEASTLRLYNNSRGTCIIRGSLFFRNGIELRVFEFLDLTDGSLLSYSYTVFQGAERIRWYDPQPHPENTLLASTFPHHLHEPPDIKHNRQPAPGISFHEPNLSTIIGACIRLKS
jgi:hypothetical protein